MPDIIKTREDSLDDNYCRVQLTQIPIYIWISNKSDLANKAEISLDMLKNHKFCSYKKIFDGTSFAKYLAAFHQMYSDKENVDLSSHFTKLVEHSNYFAIDFPISRNSKSPTFMYSDLFKGKAVFCKKSNYVFSLQLVYLRNDYQKLEPFLETIINELF